MNNYLIVYVEVPEAAKVYYAVALTSEDSKKLEACHHKMINGEDWPESDWLCEFLQSDKVRFLTDDDVAPIYRGQFRNLNIIVTGFFM